MKKVFKNVLKFLVVLYIIVCGLLYFFQEKIIFHPRKLSPDYHFNFSQQYEEFQVKANDGILLNGVLFKNDSAKGLIFYLHGNGGSIESYADVAAFYGALHYDVCMFDYRGYGKSEGNINNLEQLFEDNQTVYNEMKKQYPEEKIILLGYSLGTGFAAKLASENRPQRLILQAPYYSLKDMMMRQYKIIPTFILKYNIATNEYLKKCTMPITVFHGTSDNTIYYGSSLKLKKEFKQGDTLITLPEQGHGRIIENPIYQTAIKNILFQ